MSELCASQCAWAKTNSTWSSARLSSLLARAAYPFVTGSLARAPPVSLAGAIAIRSMAQKLTPIQNSPKLQAATSTSRVQSDRHKGRTTRRTRKVRSRGTPRWASPGGSHRAMRRRPIQDAQQRRGGENCHPQVPGQTVNPITNSEVNLRAAAHQCSRQ